MQVKALDQCECEEGEDGEENVSERGQKMRVPARVGTCGGGEDEVGLVGRAGEK